MSTRFINVLWLAATLHVTGAMAQGNVVPTATLTTTPAPGGILISITNEYEAKLDFGPLGKGWRKGTDKVVEGVLKRQGQEYVGIVKASVDSNQLMADFAGPVSGCPGHYVDSQLLQVTGHPIGGFNPQVQTVTPATTATHAVEYLKLEFAPVTMTSKQPGLRRPPRNEHDPFLGDLVISCHTLIDTLSGIAFLPLNDSRWTMQGGGYIIALPSSGTLVYRDETVPTAGGAQLGPFNAMKSDWTITVERLR